MLFLDPWWKTASKPLRYKTIFALFRQMATIVLSRTIEKVKKNITLPHHFRLIIVNTEQRTTLVPFPTENEVCLPPEKAEPPTKKWPQVKVSVCNADQPTSRMHLPSLWHSAPPVFLGLPFSSFSFFLFSFFSFLFFLFYFGFDGEVVSSVFT